VNGDSLNFNVSGLKNCEVDIACTLADTSTAGTHVYAIEVTGRCGDGDMAAERIIQVGTLFEN
jgi:hypothetical protein